MICNALVIMVYGQRLAPILLNIKDHQIIFEIMVLSFTDESQFSIPLLPPPGIPQFCPL
jgi:hypothetical protein